jgi:hypothetical protein
MPSSEPVNWQPISQMPLVASMIDGALSDTTDHIQTLTKARAQPYVLDDATIDRVERVHREQLEFVDIYAGQLRRWRDHSPSAAQRRELDRPEEKNRLLRQVTTDVLSPWPPRSAHAVTACTARSGSSATRATGGPRGLCHDGRAARGCRAPSRADRAE